MYSGSSEAAAAPEGERPPFCACRSVLGGRAGSAALRERSALVLCRLGRRRHGPQEEEAAEALVLVSFCVGRGGCGELGRGRGAAWRGRGSVPARSRSVSSRDGAQPFFPCPLRFVSVLGPVPVPVLLGMGPGPCPSCAPHPPRGLRPAPVFLAEAAASRPIPKAWTAGNGEWSLFPVREDVKGRKSCC